MSEPTPSRVRIISHKAVNDHQVCITMEIIVDVHRLAEVGRAFLSQAVDQISRSRAKPAKATKRP